MRIGILGTGPMTRALGGQLVRAGHEVVVGSRDPERAQRLSSEIGGTAGTDHRTAAQSDVVLVAVDDRAALEVVRSLTDVLDGVILVDLNNPIDPPHFESRYAGGASLGERIAEAAPGARVVKAFNTVYAEWLEPRASGALAEPVQVLIASDDEPAKATVSGLVEAIGCLPIDVGGLRVARHLENLAGFEVDLVQRGVAPYIGVRLVAGNAL
ncbi:NAD(P)-binding domain-containing protein [Diaminobutyricibacter tongyongensis]|uniref:NAD(P)-binding domain-containing protein n=1 Tax=Leifsonia tongyongensis TaxID=1268043 RepID=A0A6L9XWX2_9MICO|nr:NAD(P)-binding domain-containing protein [Diaminobutyricibacter tongyongensis]